MELSRRKTLGALGVAVVAAALPASAAKAAFPPEILTMGYLPTEEGGIFALVQCNDPVVSVTARLFDESHTVELGRFDLTLSEGGSPTYGVWAGPPLTGI